MNVSDEIITLEYNTNIINIILNETSEIVGYISFNYIDTKYLGDFGCHIYDKYRNKHYATHAMLLLKKLLKNIKKEILLSISYDNIISDKIISKLDAELIFEGIVPEEYSKNYSEELKHVKVYKLKI